DVEILRTGSLSIQDFVVEDDLLLFLLVIHRLHGACDLFEVIIAQTGLGFYHRQSPNGPFVIRGIAAFRTRSIWLSQAGEGESQRCAGDCIDLSGGHVGTLVRLCLRGEKNSQIWFSHPAEYDSPRYQSWTRIYETRLASSGRSHSFWRRYPCVPATLDRQPASGWLA